MMNNVKNGLSIIGYKYSICLRDGPLFTPHYFTNTNSTNTNDITIFCGFGIISEKIDLSDC